MLDQIEQQELQEYRLEPRLVTPPALPAESDQRQRRRMVIALILLLVALGLVLVKDRDFWFPSAQVAESEEVDDSTPVATVETVRAAAPTVQPTVPITRHRETPLAASRVTEAVPAAPPAAPTSRAVLPPLRVDVVANGQYQPVKPGGSPSMRIELQPVSSAPATPEVASANTAPVTNAGDRVQMSAGQVVSRSVRPEYPLLARQMKVQGQVDLQVKIGKDGGIQDLDVTSGPAILADAAREAVKQWRFKPYLQGGQPVETQVPVTVHFTILTK